MKKARPGEGFIRRLARRIAETAVPLLAASALGQLCLPGCSLIVDTNTVQCKTNIDCQAKGGALETAVCSDGICVQALGCTSHADCFASLEMPAVCRPFDRTCQVLFTDECRQENMDPKALAALQNNADTILLGVLSPLTTDQEGTGRPILNATTVAAKEINDNSGGIPPFVAGSGPTRPLAFVACDTAGAQAAPAFRHLVDVLKLPAIIGPPFSGTLTENYSIATTGHTLLISPAATASSISQLPDGGLVWRTAPPDTLQANAIAELISKRLEAEIKAIPGIVAPVKLAVLFRDDSYGSGLEIDIRATVKLNGEPLSATNPNYKFINYGSPDKTVPGSLQGTDAAVAGVVAQKPHIIALVGTDEAASIVLPAIEAAWTETTYRPRYIVTDGVQVPQLPPVIAADTAKAGTLQKRVFGTVPGTQSVQFENFVARYRATSFPGTPGSPDVFGTAGAYDATYMLAYSVFAADQKPLTGEVIAEGFGRLIDGTPVQLGSTESKSTAFATLATGANIDIDGASGPLKFNLAVGEAPSDIQFWCVTTAGAIVNTGLFLNAANTLEGTFSCP